MKQISAFAYLYNYYLIPEEYGTPEAFLAAAAARPTLTLTRLCEDGCIAPYFIDEATELTRIRLADPDRIHLIDAHLLSRDEYNARLGELICANCAGCLHYTPPAEGESVDTAGHEKEMTLDGLCLLRVEGKPAYTLIDAADAFWKDMLEAEDSIRKPLFDGELTEAADALGVIFARHFPSAKETIFAVNRSLGQRYLMFGALSPEARLINRYVISRAPLDVTEYWMLFDYLPRGISRYEPQTGYDLYQTPPTVEFKRLPGKLPRYALEVFSPPAVGGIRTAHETFRYLCAELGEDLLFTRTAELRIDQSADYTRHRPLRDFRQALRAECGFFARRRISLDFSRPMEMVLPAIERGSRSAAERVSTMAPGLSLELAGREFGGRMARIVDEWDLPVCTLALTLPGEAAAREKLAARVCGEYFGDLQKDALLALVDIARTGIKLYIDFLAAAAGETIEALRDLTPEFEGMDPRLTVRTRTETRVMKLNYTLDLIKRVPVKEEVRA